MLVTHSNEKVNKNQNVVATGIICELLSALRSMILPYICNCARSAEESKRTQSIV